MSKITKLIYVDDEPDIRSIVEFAFDGEPNLELRLCASGFEALDAARMDPPDLVLLDVMMPGMDGPETLAKLRSLPHMQDVPVVFITAKVQPKEVEHFLAMGAAGVLAKPFDAMLLPQRALSFLVPRTASSDSKSVTPVDQASARRAATLLALQDRFKASLAERIELIKKGGTKVLAAARDHTALAELRRHAHTLAGSAGTFGYKRVSSVAGRLEQHLDEWMKPNAVGVNAAVLDNLIEKLLDAALLAPEHSLDDLHDFVSRVFGGTGDRPGRSVVIIEDDRLLAEKLSLQLSVFGWEAQVYGSTTDAAARMAGKTPDAMVIDIMLPEGPLAGPEFVTIQQAKAEYHIPLIAISARWDWQARLAAARAGADTYLVKPIDPTGLAVALESVVRRYTLPDYRVLIVDDDELLAKHYVEVLAIAGMKCRSISRVDHLLDALAEHHPELILMDLHMPGCSGIEAARVIRQDQRFISIPIIFLTTETSPALQREALFTGADDFLQKPIGNTELIVVVANRAERFRSLTKLIRRDSLTGLLNHVAFNLRLEAEIERSRRCGSRLTVAMLDIDHFKQVNDSYGHLVGDRVIVGIGQLMTARLRAADIIARYGGEEFIVAFPDTTPEVALTVVNQLRETFARIIFPTAKGEFSCTFSAGLVGLLPENNVTEAIDAADRALYAAKHNGRNQVVEYGTTAMRRASQ